MPLWALCVRRIFSLQMRSCFSLPVFSLSQRLSSQTSCVKTCKGVCWCSTWVQALCGLTEECFYSRYLHCSHLKVQLHLHQMPCYFMEKGVLYNKTMSFRDEQVSGVFFVRLLYPSPPTPCPKKVWHGPAICFCTFLLSAYALNFFLPPWP